MVNMAVRHAIRGHAVPTLGWRGVFARASRTLAVKADFLPSRFANVPEGPPDAILGVTEAFKVDPSPLKINLGVGAYRDANGQPYVLPAVREAEKRIMERQMDMEYLGVAGLKSFVDKALALAYGQDNYYLKSECVAGLQTLSGTGACRMAGELISRFLERPGGGKPLVLLPHPTWANHHAIFRDSGCSLDSYTYYNPDTKALDFSGCLSSLSSAPSGAVVLLHATAHNPTGVDPSTEQWREISSIMKKRRLQPLFDSAYQGFTSGDTNVDAASIRLFVDDGHKVILAQSFSKNMGLYGHRVGCLSVLTDSSQEARAVNSQLKIIARPIWSNPPITGVRIVDEILGNSDLENQWRSELKGMADRIKYMRTGLREALRAVGSKHNWDHIVNQNGMFTYSGLSANCVERLAKDYSIYLTKNGRISMAGVYESNIQHLAKGIHEVTK